MVELKVTIDGVQRVVCGVSDATKCQDIILALAQATGQIGRFNLVEKCQDSERSLRPHENPLRVMSKWGPNSRDAYFLLRKTGSSPGNSRPPSVTKELGDRFKQVNSPTESIEEFPQQRYASVRRSQTFSGYRGGTALQNHEPRASDAALENAKQELNEIISIQLEQLAHQHQDIRDIENAIQILAEYKFTDYQHNDSDSGIEEFELRSKRNKAELRELEFWESELEIEQQLQADLTHKIGKLKDRIEKYEQKLSLRGQEIAILTQQIEEQREMLRLQEDEVAEARLCQIKEEIVLLEQEQKEYLKSAQEMEMLLAELDKSLDDKTSEESRLREDLARENMKEFTQTPPALQEDEPPSGSHDAKTLPWPIRQRAESTPVEMYATFPFRRLVSARSLAVDEPSGDNPEGIFV